MFGAANFGLIFIIVTYLALWLPCVRGNTLGWEVNCPLGGLVVTLCSVLWVLSSLIGLWPVWGVFTPAICTIFLVGFLMILHFIPAIGVAA